MPDPEFVIAHTRAWVERAVIGLNLCPFAKAPQVKGQVRYAVSAATEAEALLASLVEELQRLAAAPAQELETTLLIHPGALRDFLEYNDFLDIADAALAALDLEGTIQVAGFHPDFQFAGSAPDDLANATNRAPYPTLHLLREESIDRAVEAFPDAAAIYGANVATLARLGEAGWDALQAQCQRDAAAAVPQTGQSGSGANSAE